ncbi:flagellar hook-associated protein FlgL [Anaeroselena agilis]|uniref:Flagellar hook-associated protein FlgL n=1 Tax=Anaeroselena agilis TaxID=3063788 RepID=A0ABU3P4D0_9FIRM|nr:flagellar hook-associated protein FlgL [Selenomonadales bacterium 4137-cl]
MRIANSTIIYNFLSSLNKSQQRMNKYQEQLSDGKIVHRPSDDPVRAIRSLRLNTDLMTNEQYTQNAKDAQSWMNQSDSSLDGVVSVLERARELVIDAVSANPEIAYTTAATEINGLINQAVSQANAQSGDRYIFAGQQDKVAGGPFERKTITVNIAGVDTPTEVVVYKGDDNKISMRIQPGAANPNQDSVNVTGEDVFGPMTTVQDSVTGEIYTVSTAFRDLLAIKDQLASGTPDLSYMSTTALTNVDKVTDRVLLARTQIGTRMATYEMGQNLLENNYVTIGENVAANDDIDIARLTIDFKNGENIYNAALAVGAKIMPQSLVDFLR